MNSNFRNNTFHTYFISLDESGDESDSNWSVTQQSTQSSKNKKKSDGYQKKKRRKKGLYFSAGQTVPKPKGSYKCTNFLKVILVLTYVLLLISIP